MPHQRRDPSASAAARIAAALALAALVAGCASAVGPGGSGGSPTPATAASSVAGPSAPAGSGDGSASAGPPAVAPTETACPAPPTTAPAAPAEPGAWPGINAPAGLRTAVEAELAALVDAIGNPDTGSTSPAWDAFERSLAGGDEAAIRARADAVLGHLRDACAAVAAFLDQPGAGAWATDVRGLLDGIAASVAGMRDAAVRGDAMGVAAAKDAMGPTLLDHFWQSVKMSNPEAWRATMPTTGWTATASHVRWSAPVWNAFDGSPGSTWLAGDVPAPQWLEVDLGAELAVTGIRLLTSQDGAGPTDHRVTVRTGTGRETELVRFSGETRDEQWLEYAASTPIPGIRYVRVTTLAAPSMIGWREMEVQVPSGSAGGPCPASSTPVGTVAKTRADPSSGASDPALAVDGDDATGWDPGPIRGGTGVRGWLRVWYTDQVRISEVRLLLGPGSPDARYKVAIFPPGEVGSPLGTIGPVPAVGGWVSLPGPDPCLPYESVYVTVESEGTPGTVRELKVLGTPAQ